MVFISVVNNIDSVELAKKMEATIAETNAMPDSGERRWLYAEAMYHMNKQRLWRKLISPDTGTKYDSFTEYFGTIETPFKKSSTYEMVGIYERFIAELQLQEDQELFDKLMQVNFFLLGTLAKAVPKYADRNHIKQWLEIAREETDVNRLAQLVKEYRQGKEVSPLPDKFTRTISEWTVSDDMPSREDLFGDLPDGSIVRISVKQIG